MSAVPIAGHLVPADPAPLAAGMERRVETLTGGLAQVIALDRDVSLLLLVPNGLATAWRDADPAQPVSSSAPQLAPASPGADEPVGRVDQAAPRLVVTMAARTLGSVALVAGMRRSVPDSGGGGEVVELAILGWELHAGTLRGAGDFGSRLELAWRRSDRAGDTFQPPPPNPQLLARLATGAGEAGP
jgi:hypothetical protein